MTQPTAAQGKIVDSSNNPQIQDRQSAITAPTGGATNDAEARTAINAIIDVLELHGLVADN